VIEKIVNCKHLTQLNIISTFNKLQMHSDSENYTIFIIALEAYKSKVLLFELINDSVSFQQYMNDVLCRLIASSWVLEFKLSTWLVKTWFVKTWFKSEFLTWVFKLSQDVRLKYSSWIRELKSSIDSKFSTRLVKTWK